MDDEKANYIKKASQNLKNKNLDNLEEISQSKQIMELYLVSPDFSNTRKWTFYDSYDKEDRTKLSCEMLDIDFLEKAKSTKNFKYYDIFRVQINIIQDRQDGKLKTTRKITKVISHKNNNAIILLPLKNPWDILFEGISEFESNLIRETQELQIREDIL